MRTTIALGLAALLAVTALPSFAADSMMMTPGNHSMMMKPGETMMVMPSGRLGL